MILYMCIYIGRYVYVYVYIKCLYKYTCICIIYIYYTYPIIHTRYFPFMYEYTRSTVFYLKKTRLTIPCGAPQRGAGLSELTMWRLGVPLSRGL